MSITISPGYTWVSGNTVTPTRLNNALAGITVSLAADSLLGRAAGAGGWQEIACTTAGRALIDDVDAAAQRNTLGLFGSSLESTVTGGLQASTVGNDLLYTTGPSVNLTAGTWIVWGSACMRTNDAAGEFWLGFRDTTASADFGQGAGMKNVGLGEIHHLSCFAVYTVAGATTIQLKAFRNGAITLELGNTAGIGGALRAVKLFG